MFQLLHCAKSQMAAIHQLASMNMQACFSPAALYHKMEWLIIILHAITQHAVSVLPPFFDVVSCVSFIGPRLPLGYGLVMHQVAERTLGNTKLRPHLGAHMGKLKSNAPIWIHKFNSWIASFEVKRYGGRNVLAGCKVYLSSGATYRVTI